MTVDHCLSGIGGERTLAMGALLFLLSGIAIVRVVVGKCDVRVGICHTDRLSATDL